MTLQNQRQLDNTLKKLRELEQLYANTEQEPVDNTYARELTLRSIKRMINQLQEEIARYQARAAIAEK